ncbi:hypothetical protein MFUL124B02_19630 [Myxococcus fulvus 124B02]|nr:hypothetical protein MFUL124B02_19630 [Myxococcus fulvus 124B02]
MVVRKAASGEVLEWSGHGDTIWRVQVEGGEGYINKRCGVLQD